MFCIVNTETEQVIVSPGTGVDELHDTYDDAERAKAKLADHAGRASHLQVFELTASTTANQK